MQYMHIYDFTPNYQASVKQLETAESILFFLNLKGNFSCYWLQVVENVAYMLKLSVCIGGCVVHLSTPNKMHHLTII